MVSRRKGVGVFAAVFVVVVIVASIISPDFGEAAVTLIPLTGVELNPLATHLPDFAELAQLGGIAGQFGDVLFAVAAGGALGFALEKSWSRLTGT